MLELLLAALVVAVDQITKVICADRLVALSGRTLPLIDGVFHLTYVENRGAAFGMLQNARWFFIVLTVAVLIGIAIFWYKERRRMSLILRLAASLVFAGALGNLIDRIALGYVRDMFDFRLIDFWVFNVADAAITVGAVCLVIGILFFGGNELFGDTKKPKKEEE